jgi:hypothetical protein
MVGGESEGNLTGGFGRSLRAPLVSLFVRARLTMLASKEHHADLLPLTELIDAGKLTPSIEATYPLDQAQEAMRQLEAGKVRGKITIAMPSPVQEKEETIGGSRGGIPARAGADPRRHHSATHTSGTRERQALGGLSPGRAPFVRPRRVFTCADPASSDGRRTDQNFGSVGGD